MAGKITVKFYGLLRRRLRTTVLEIESDDATILVLLRRAEKETGQNFLEEMLDRESGLLTGTIILIDGENIRLKQGLETRVRDGETVALFSPAGGG